MPCPPSDQQVLLSYGASSTAHDYLERTALHVACSEFEWKDDKGEKIVQELLRAPGGMSVLDSRDRYGDTPLHGAVLSGSASCCDLLLSAGSKATLMLNQRGQTPYQLASRYGCKSSDPTESSQVLNVLQKHSAHLIPDADPSDDDVGEL